MRENEEESLKKWRQCEYNLQTEKYNSHPSFPHLWILHPRIQPTSDLIFWSMFNWIKIQNPYLQKTDCMSFENQISETVWACNYEIGSTLLQNIHLWVDCSLKSHTPMYQVHWMEWKAARVSIWHHCQDRAHICPFTKWSSDNEPLSWYSLRKSNWWISYKGRRKAIVLSEL